MTDGPDATLTGRFVVMSGLSASGKSMLGRSLAERLELDLIDKDDDLEALFDERDDPQAPASAEDRQRLSRAADQTFIDRANRSDGAVLVSFWRRDELSSISGTPTDWLGHLGDVTEVFCRCSPDVALERFVERVRHPGHGDLREVTPDATQRMRELAALGPLGIGRLVELDTSTPVDVEAVVDRLYPRKPSRAI